MEGSGVSLTKDGRSVTMLVRVCLLCLLLGRCERMFGGGERNEVWYFWAKRVRTGLLGYTAKVGPAMDQRETVVVGTVEGPRAVLDVGG